MWPPLKIQTRATHHSQRQLQRDTWLTWANEFPGRLEWKFFVHGTEGGLEETQRLLEQAKADVSDIVFAPVKNAQSPRCVMRVGKSLSSLRW